MMEKGRVGILLVGEMGTRLEHRGECALEKGGGGGEKEGVRRGDGRWWMEGKPGRSRRDETRNGWSRRETEGTRREVFTFLNLEIFAKGEGPPLKLHLRKKKSENG